MNVQNYKCLSCGAPLVFDDKSQQLSCSSCDNKYTVEQFNDFDKFNSNENVEREIKWDIPISQNYTNPAGGSKIFSCPSCGAEIIGDENTIATECPYCDNPAVVTENVSGFLKPDFVIPFKKNKEEAKAALRNFYDKKFLLPKEFKSENRLEKIKGIYVPFWLFNCDGDAAITFSAQKVHSWRSGDYRYTKVSHFAAFRSGSLSFTRVPVDASSKLDDNYMDALEPFDAREFVDFDGAYMAGYLADKFDVTAEQCMPRAKERITNSIKEQFRNTVQGYTSVSVKNSNINMSGGKVQYGLLPVWVLNTKYEGKTYTFAMNGQTGKVVGELPCSMKKMILLGLGAFAAAWPVIYFLFSVFYS